MLQGLPNFNSVLNTAMLLELVLMGYCRLQVDDDSYVRVDKVLSRVKEAPKSRMFMGFIENPGGGPHRNRASQWYVTPEEWPSERYPPWAHGAGYVISQVGATPS